MGRRIFGAVGTALRGDVATRPAMPPTAAMEREAVAATLAFKPAVRPLRGRLGALLSLGRLLAAPGAERRQPVDAAVFLAALWSRLTAPLRLAGGEELGIARQIRLRIAGAE